MKNVKQGDTIAVWFSCGAASAVAARKTIQKYGKIATIRVVNSPVREEDDDNQRFLKDVEKWLGVPVESAINPLYMNTSAVTVWDKRQYMSGVDGAPCTTELKKEARYLWESRNKPNWHVLGFTADEKERSKNFKLMERANLLEVLIDMNITKDHCFEIIRNAGIRLPRIYSLGYPNANCIGCVKASSPTYWNHVRRVHPEVFLARAIQSRRIGARLVRVNGERIYLDELDAEQTGQSMKTMRNECGVFCEEEYL